LPKKAKLYAKSRFLSVFGATVHKTPKIGFSDCELRSLKRKPRFSVQNTRTLGRKKTGFRRKPPPLRPKVSVFWAHSLCSLARNPQKAIFKAFWGFRHFGQIFDLTKMRIRIIILMMRIHTPTAEASKVTSAAGDNPSKYPKQQSPGSETNTDPYDHARWVYASCGQPRRTHVYCAYLATRPTRTTQNMFCVTHSCR